MTDTAVDVAFIVRVTPQAGHRERMTSLLIAALAVNSQPDAIVQFQVAVAPAETLAVTQQGTGLPVVIVPGLLGSAYGFRTVMERLAEEGYAVTVIDPLGTGASARPDSTDWSLVAQADRVAAALDTLIVRDAMFIVHSGGAPIGLRLAYRRPDLVSGFVSINGGPAERMSTPGVALALRLAPLLRLLGAEGQARKRVRSGLLDSSGDRSWVTESIVEIYGAPYREDLFGTLRMLREMSRASESEPLAPNLSRITAPVLLLIGGAVEPAIEQKDFDSLLARVPDVRVDTIRGAGSYIHEEDPEAVVSAFLRFAFSVRAGSTARR